MKYYYNMNGRTTEFEMHVSNIALHKTKRDAAPFCIRIPKYSTACTKSARETPIFRVIIIVIDENA